MRILILEDTPTDAELVCHELRRAGLAVETRCVDTRADFLAQLQDFDPEAVLADYCLPQFTAGEALRLVKEQGRIIPFLLVTGTQSEEVAVRCLKEGMDDYILKSSLARLPAALLNAVEKRRAERESAQALAALSRSEEMYRTVTENSQDLITTIDAHGRVTYASASHANVLGYLPTRLYVQQLLERVHPDDQAGLARATRQAFRGGKPQRVVWRHRTDNNGWLVLETLCGTAMIEGQACLVAVSCDITERRQMERRLAESEERFRRLAENAQDMIYRYRLQPSPGFEYVSPAATELTGYTPAEFYADPHLGVNIMHPDDRPLFRAAVGNPDRKTEPIMLRWLHKDGRVVWTEQRAALVYNGAVDPVAVECIARDITRHVEADAELRAGLERLETAMKGTVKAMAVTAELRDPYTAGHQRRVSQLAAAIAREMGLEPDRIEGIRLAGLIHDIGKVVVPAEILNRPGLLSDLETTFIKTHPQAGYEIIKSIDFPWPLAQVTLQHHERLDGSGYPSGLAGEEIVLEARILAVADVIEAMSSHRPYRPALGTCSALEEISRNSGRLYDAHVVEACRQVIEREGFEFE